MKTIPSRDDLRFVGGKFFCKLAGDFNCALVSFRARIRKEGSIQSAEFYEFCGGVGLRLRVVKIAHVNDLCRLFRDSFDERRIVVPQDVDGNARKEVNIFFSVDVVKIRALAALQNNFVTLEHGQIIFIVLLKNFFFNQMNHSRYVKLNASLG